MGKPTREKKHFKKKFKSNDKKEPEVKPTKNAKQGRISKPQKSSKHKKIKSVDPFYVGNRVPDKKLQGANLKPKNVDQGSSRAEQMFREMKNLAKKIPKKKLKGNKNPFERVPIEDRRGMEHKMPKAPKFIQGKKESENQFLRRMDTTVKSAIARAQFEDKYDIQKDKSGKPTKERTESTIKNTKRLQEKKDRKKEREEQRLEDRQTGFEKYKDEVKFGEVAMEPPKLVAVPRKAPKQIKLAGGRSSLLLKEIMQENSMSGKLTEKPTREIGKTMKRKFLSPAQQVSIDAQRDSAINMYREMKAKKMAQRAQT